jgi:uncharacterized protein (TIGR02246 family)
MPRRIAVFLTLLACSMLVQASPKEDAQAAYGKFFTSFTTGNHEEVVALFAPDALFYGTGSPEVVTTTEGVRQYFTRALAGPGRRAIPLENTALLLSDNAVAISGKWQSVRILDGKEVIGAPARNTVVMQKRGDRWLIVQFHNSPTPKPPAAAAPVR